MALSDDTLRKILADAGLPTHELALSLLRADFDTAQRCYEGAVWEWPDVKAAPPLIKACDRLLRATTKYQMTDRGFIDRLTVLREMLACSGELHALAKKRDWIAILGGGAFAVTWKMLTGGSLQSRSAANRAGAWHFSTLVFSSLIATSL